MSRLTAQELLEWNMFLRSTEPKKYSWSDRRYSAGYDAYYQSIDEGIVDVNPYNIGSNNWMAWQAGWKLAETELVNEVVLNETSEEDD